MPIEKDSCPTCGGIILNQNKGSLTQWIAQCSCSASSKIDQTPTISIRISICSNCGKSIASRAGSLTQWVFGEGRCECGKPSPIEKSLDKYIQPAFNESFDENVSQIELDDEKFPTERYRAIADLGTGSVGKIYLCQDRILKKLVAVKTLLKVTSNQLISFQKEAKATSKLDHPYIIQILDFGSTKGGSPYMVMDYFKGVSLESYLNDFGPLDLPRVIAISSKLSEALEYAHSSRVFHRDLKPSNILICDTTEGMDVRIIDFGVAKLKEESNFTTQYQNETLAGTPAYMSPDPAVGLSFDSRSEIYSLGCVLFEAITGELPFVASSPLELISLHVNKKPPSLAETLKTEVNEDIENLIAKCLEKDPDQRFQTLKEFRTSLMNLNIESSVETKKPEQKKTNQHKLTTITALAIGSIAIVISINVLGGWSQVSNIILALCGDASSQTKIAMACETMNPSKPELATYFYTAAAQKGNAEAQEKLGDFYYEGKGNLDKNIELASMWYQKAADQENVVAQYKLGNCFFQKREIGKDLKKAFFWYKKAAESGYSKAQNSVGLFFQNGYGVEKDLIAAVTWFRRSVKQKDPSGQNLLAHCLYAGTGCTKDFQRAFRLFKQSAQMDNTNSLFMLGKMTELGQGTKKDVSRAAKLYKNAAEMDNYFAQSKLADFYYFGTGLNKNLDSSIYWYKKALSNPSAPELNKAINLKQLARLYYKKGNYTKAEPLYRQSIQYDEKKFGKDSPKVAIDLSNLAQLYAKLNDYDKAKPLYLRALQIDENAYGPIHKDVAFDLNNLAELYRKHGKYTEAEPLYLRSLAIWKRELGPNHPKVAANLNDLAMLYSAQNKYSKAENLFKQAVTIYEKEMGPNHPYVAFCLEHYAKLLRKTNRNSDAESLEARVKKIRANKD